MRKLLLLGFASFIVLLKAQGQVLIAGWDFQTTGTGGTAAAAAPGSPSTYTANVGTGTLYLNGTNGASTWITATTGNEVSGFGGTALNAGGATGLSTTTSGVTSLALLGGASPFTANGKSITFAFSMTGLKSLVVSYASQKTASGFGSQAWEYSTDASSWTAISTVTTVGTSFATQTLSTVTGLNNATNAFLRITFTGATGSSGNNRLDNIQLNATTIPNGTWFGTTSNNWATAANWMGGVPTASTDVAIPSGTPNSPSYSSAPSTIASLTIASGATLTNSSILTVTNALTNAGTINFGTVNVAGTVANTGSVTGNGTVNLNGASAQTMTGPGTISNLKISNASGVTISTGAIKVTGTLTPQAGQLAANGNLVLASSSTGTARIAAIDGIINTGSISGNVTVERYIPSSNRAYRFLTPSVTTSGFIKANWQEGASTNTANPTPNYGTHITGNTVDQTNGFDGTITGNPSLFLFDNAAQTWGNIANADATVLRAGNAYRLLIRGDRTVDLTAPASPSNTATTLRATGTLLTGTVIFNSTGIGATAGLPLLSGTIGNYSFVGNPYASSVNWDNVHTAAVGLEDYYYTWDPTRSTHGAYVYWDKSDGSNGGSVGSAVSQDIQPGQAIFVRSSSAAPILTFSETNKSSGLTNTFRTQTTLTGKLTVGLTNAALMSVNNGFDGANILFADNFSAAIDGEDIPKINNQDENLSVFSSSINLMKEARPTIAANDTVQLRVWQLASNNYILTFDAQQFTANKQAFLVDGYLNTVSPINIAGNTQYPFTTSTTPASYADTRFKIVFKTAGALPATIASIKAFQKNTGIQVEWNTVNETNLSKYEVEKSVDGTNFQKSGTVTAENSSSYQWYDAAPVNGYNYYRIKMVDKNGATKLTQVVSVKIGGVKATFTIVGNPIKNKQLALQMENIEKGNYSIVLFNSLGQAVLTKSISHAGGSSTETFALGNIVPGTYQLAITGNDAKETKTIVVE